MEGAATRDVERGESRGFRGTNQSGMRDYNERLVLSLVRQHGSLAKSDIARITGLSAQTISVIMRALEADGLLVRGEPVRGRVGQPSVPMSLKPDGAFFIGAKIGRRTADLALIDFVGTVRTMAHAAYRYPEPAQAVDFVTSGIEAMRKTLSPDEQKRIAGLGIAMPFELWNWADTVGAPGDVLDAWRRTDIGAELQARLPFPVFVQNDATAACGAELVFGTTRDLRDFVYVYVGTFIGGGVVLNGTVYAGQTGNAGAIGSMPVPASDGRIRQLIDVASIAVLEATLKSQGRDASVLWTSPESWGGIGPALDRWIEDAGAAIAHAVISSVSLIDFEAIVIDGWIPLDVRARLVDAVRHAVRTLDAEGITLPEIREGTVGIHARALGAASLPLSGRFLLGQTLIPSTFGQP